MTDQAWNRCDYCGKFISYADFDTERAKRDFDVVWRPSVSGGEPDEQYDTYHVACKQKSEVA
jgi:hypothetical protein